MDQTRCRTSPKIVGEEFARQYYIVLNKSPQNLHHFYTPDACWTHDDIDPNGHHTIHATGRKQIREFMVEQSKHYHHSGTRIKSVTTVETLANGLLVLLQGEISFNEFPMRQFSQSFVLVPKSPFQYFVQNDLFRFCDYDDEDDTTESDGIVEISDPEYEPQQLHPQQQQQPDWGTQCEEYIEPYDVLNQYDVPNMEPQHERERLIRENVQQQNEVRLDNSDSGLSSDAEKQMMDMQSNHLRNVLQDAMPRLVSLEAMIRKDRTTTPPGHRNNGDNQQQSQQQQQPDQRGDDISEKQTQMFRDSCILTINNVANPNIEFDDNNAKVVCGDGDQVKTSAVPSASASAAPSSAASAAPSENDKTQESLDGSNDDNEPQAKPKHRKRRERKALKVSFDESIEVLDSQPDDKKPHEIERSSTPEKLEKKTPSEQSDASEKSHTSKSSNEREVVQEEVQTPTVSEVKKISYADLARGGNSEWVDVASRNPAPTNRPVRSAPRRNSRTERNTPTKSYGGDGMRTSPKNDHLQVFVGNIPHGASEDDIRKMFSRFGHVTRIRLHVNNRKPFLPHYAFITYDSVNAVKQCLKKKSVLTWDGHKLNVNGDATVDIWDDAGNPKTTEAPSTGSASTGNQARERELKMFSKNFILEKEGKNFSDSDSSAVNEPVVVKKNADRRKRRH